jgi:hypothetical protein
MMIISLDTENASPMGGSLSRNRGCFKLAEGVAGSIGCVKLDESFVDRPI